MGRSFVSKSRLSTIGLGCLALVASSITAVALPVAAHATGPGVPKPDLGHSVPGHALAAQAARAGTAASGRSASPAAPTPLPTGQWQLALGTPTAKSAKAAAAGSAAGWRQLAAGIAVAPLAAGHPVGGLSVRLARSGSGGPSIRLARTDQAGTGNGAGQQGTDQKSTGQQGTDQQSTGSNGDSAPVAVRLPAGLLAGQYGADFAARLRWQQQPVDATTGGATAAPTAVTAGTDASRDTLLTVQLGQAPVMLVAAAGPVSATGTGSYAATPLSTSASWQVSTQTGSFTWSQSLRVPPPAAGPSPQLAFDYDSGSIDGETGSTNNQPSQIGDGWSLAGAGYIERSYTACAQDGVPSSGDMCWKTDNATVSLAGHSGLLVKDSSTGQWRLQDDDNTRIEYLTSCVNGTHDNDCWRLTTTDGTQYYFGRNHLPGWTTGKPATNSAWTEPVFGNNPGEPGYTGTFATESLTQAWRWNLDYVVDPHGNSEAFYYNAEMNRYASNATNTNATIYVRGGSLARIDYGMRAGSELTASAPQRVLFDTANRCVSTTNCDSAHPTNWPDVPWDQNCTASPCTGKYSPTFWSTTMLAKVHTQLLSGTSYTDVETWTLAHTFPSPGDGTSAALWFNTLSHSGLVGGTVTVPTVYFGGTAMPNRVWAVDGLAPLDRYRLAWVIGETGSDTTISYSAQQCTPTNLPVPQSDTMRCYQQWWTPQVTPPQPAQSDWFHKYVVTAVSANPETSDAASSDDTYYDYLGTPGWRYDNSPITPSAYRTWSIWAGYSQVRVRHGHSGSPSTQLTTVDTFYQGLDGDRAAPSGGTKSVSVTASDGSSVPDSLWLAGQIREETITNGQDGARISNMIDTPWASAVTANDGVNTARMIGDGDSVTKTALAAGGDRTTEVKTSHDSYGRVTSVDDLGDPVDPSDDRCTTTSYVDNTSAWLVNDVSEAKVVGRTCSQQPSLPTDAISDLRTSYDGNAWGVAPTKGDVTEVDTVKSYTGSTPNWLTTTTTSYDALGRPLVITDPRTGSNRTTTNAYTPAAGGPLTSMTVTNTLGWKTTTTYQAAWNAPLTITDPNGEVTTLSYDPLGRRSKVWLPDRPTSQTPTLSYAYSISSTAPSYIATTGVNATGASTSYTIYDGLLRPRQTQTSSEGGGTIVTDTQYDGASQVVTSNAAYWTNSVNPSGTLFVPQSQQQIPAQTETQYDGDGRVLKTTLMSLGSERYHTSYSYGGDHVDVTPPAGGVATSTYTDTRGNTSQLLQYHGGSPSGAADVTSYRYDHADRMVGMTDPAGDAWSWGYDVLGNQISATDPDTGTTTSSYDDAGRLTSQTTAPRVTTVGQPAAAVILAWSYDAMDRKTGEFTGSTSGPQLAAWTYDPTIAGAQVRGQLGSSTRYVGSTAGVLGTPYTRTVTGYDAAYRVTGSTVTIPATASTGPLAGSYGTSYSYGPDGQLVTQGDQAEAGLPAETLNYAYSVLGHPASLHGGTSGSVAYLSTIVYTHINQVAQYTRPAGTTDVSTYGYDQATGAVTEIQDTTATGSTTATVADRVYGYDDAGLVTSATDSPTGQPVDAQCYGYDYLQRLTTAWTATAAGQCATAPATGSLGGPAPYWQSYGYDVLGNRTSATRHGVNAGDADLTDSSSYPAPGAGVAQPHIPTSVTHTSSTGVPATTSTGYTSDPAGDTVGRGSEGLSYTPDGMLDTVADGSQSQSNVYDADGNLLLQTDPTGTTLYLGDSQLHRDPGAGTASGTRIYTSPDGTPVAEYSSSGKASWLSTDRDGTVTVTVDAVSGAVTRRHLDPFGAERDGSSPSWIDNRAFLNHPATALTGLVHLGARDYDPSLGRFLTADPVLDPASPQQDNGYSYADDDPVTLADPSGLRPAGDKDDTDAGDWGGITTCPSCSHPTPKFNPSDGWATPTVTIDTHDVQVTYKTPVGRMCHVGLKCYKTHTISLYDLMHPAPGPKNYCGGWSWACTLVGYNQARNCIASPSVGECLGAALALVSDVFLVGGIVKAGSLLAEAALQLGAESTSSMITVAEDVTTSTVDSAPGVFADPATSCLNSFTGDTPVTMADGSRKPIKDVRVGDKVLATDPQTGQTTAEPVAALIRHTGKHAMVLITLADGSVLDSTDGHPIWDATTGRFTDADDLHVGDRIETTGAALITIAGMSRYSADLTAYNLQIDQIHTYYAGTTPVLVHNSCASWSVDDLSASGARTVGRNNLTRAGQKLSRHGGQGNFPKPSGPPAEISRLGQEQLDDILTDPNTVTRPISGGNFPGGRFYIAPDGRGAVYDASGTFQYFGVFQP